MHLAVEATAAKHSGAATVLLDFLQTAVTDPRVSRITVYCAPNAKRDFSLAWSDKLEVIEKPAVERFRIVRLLWYMGGLGLQLRKLKADVVICMAGQGQAVLPTTHVTFIQQSLPFSSEALARIPRRRRLEMAMIRELMRRSCQTSQKVIVQTPTMADWVSRGFGIDHQKIEIIMPSANLPVGYDSATELEVMNRVPWNSRLLYVGSSSGYKMIDTIVQGMYFLRQRQPRACLFLTTTPPPKYANVPGIVCLGHLKRETLRSAYHLATAIVMPSLVETVGLPMIEAMSLGKPVIAADRPYAHDICEDAALFYDPLDEHDFAFKAHYVLDDNSLRESMRTRGRELMTRRRQTLPYRRMVDSVISAAYRA